VGAKKSTLNESVEGAEEGEFIKDSIYIEILNNIIDSAIIYKCIILA
jgi:hypothetical protein